MLNRIMESFISHYICLALQETLEKKASSISCVHYKGEQMQFEVLWNEERETFFRTTKKSKGFEFAFMLTVGYDLMAIAKLPLNKTILRDQIQKFETEQFF